MPTRPTLNVPMAADTATPPPTTMSRRARRPSPLLLRRPTGAEAAVADPVIAEAAATEAAAIGPASAEPTERAVETGDVTAATDSHQQDPGPEGTELAPRG